MSQKRIYRIGFSKDAKHWEPCTVDFRLTFGQGDKRQPVRMKKDFTVGGEWVDRKKLTVLDKKAADDRLSARFTLLPSADLSLEDIIKVRGQFLLRVGVTPDLAMALPGVPIPGLHAAGLPEQIRECAFSIDYPVEIETHQQQVADPNGQPNVILSCRVVCGISCQELTRQWIQSSIKFSRGRWAIIVDEKGKELNGWVQTTVRLEPGADPVANQMAVVTISCKVGSEVLTLSQPVDLSAVPVVGLHLSKERMKLDGHDVVQVSGVVENAKWLPAETVAKILGSLNLSIDGAGGSWVVIGSRQVQVDRAEWSLVRKDEGQLPRGKPPALAVITMAGQAGTNAINVKKDLALEAPVTSKPCVIKIRVITPGPPPVVSESDGPVAIDADSMSAYIISAELIELGPDGAPTGSSVSGANWNVTSLKASKDLSAEASFTTAGDSNRCIWTVRSNRLIVAGTESTPPEGLDLSFEATLPDGRIIKRLLACTPQPISVSLEATPEDRKLHMREGPTGTVMIRVESITSRPIKGVSANFTISPNHGTLSASSCETDQKGEARVAYTPPSDFPPGVPSGSMLSVTVTAFLGPNRILVGDVTFEVALWIKIQVTVTKPGFAVWKNEVDIQGPGHWLMSVIAAGGSKPTVLHASVSAGTDVKVENKGDGLFDLSLQGDAAGGTLPNVALDLGEEVKASITKIRDTLAQPDPPAIFKDVAGQINTFLDFRLVGRLAEEKCEEYECTAKNLRALALVTRVLVQSLDLIGRNFERLKADLTSFFGNVIKIVINLAGEKILGVLATAFKSAASRMVTVIARQIGSRPWLRGPINTLLSPLRSLIAWLERQIDALKTEIERRWGSGGGVPADVRSRIPRNNSDGPLPSGRGQLSRQSLQDAEHQLLEAQQSAQRIRSQLGSAETKLRQLQDEVERIEQEISNLGSRVSPGSRTVNAQLKTARSKLSQSRTKLEEARSGKTDLTNQMAAADTKVAEVESYRSSLEWVEDAFTDILGVFNRGINLLNVLFLSVLGRLADIVGTTLRGRMGREWTRLIGSSAMDPFCEAVSLLAGESAKGMLADTLGKPAYSAADYFFKWKQSLVEMQLKTAAACLEMALQKTELWQDMPHDRCEGAVRWYYDHIEASSFHAEELEAWQDEFVAATVSSIVDMAVLVSRVFSITVSVFGLLASIPTAGSSAAAGYAFKFALSETIEKIDALFDYIKAIATGSKSFYMTAQLWDYLPSFTSFTVLFYDDSSVVARATNYLKTK